MPQDVIPDLAAVGHDVQTCAQEGIAGMGDPAIARHAAGESRILITFDLDFADIREYPPGSYPGIVVLRLNDPDISSAQMALARLLATVDEGDFSGTLIIVGDQRIRIRRPDATP